MLLHVFSPLYCLFSPQCMSKIGNLFFFISCTKSEVLWCERKNDCWHPYDKLVNRIHFLKPNKCLINLLRFSNIIDYHFWTIGYNLFLCITSKCIYLFIFTACNTTFIRNIMHNIVSTIFKNNISNFILLVIYIARKTVI